MKLLILGLLLIGIVLIQIYYTNKNKEDFQNNVDKALVAGERSFLQGQDKHWDVRKQGIGAGLLIYIIRTWGGYPDGIAFSILIMNALVPLIDYYTRPKVLGEK